MSASNRAPTDKQKAIGAIVLAELALLLVPIGDAFNIVELSVLRGGLLGYLVIGHLVVVPPVASGLWLCFVFVPEMLRSWTQAPTTGDDTHEESLRGQPTRAASVGSDRATHDRHHATSTDAVPSGEEILQQTDANRRTDRTGASEHAPETDAEAEAAGEVATESDEMAIDQTRGGVRDEHRERHHQQLQDEMTELRAELDDAETLATDGSLADARERLSTLESRITAITRRALIHDFAELRETAEALDDRREACLSEVTDRLHARRIPDEIPEAPDVTVEHEALAEEEPLGSGGSADVMKATLAGPDGDVPLAIKRPRMTGTLHAEAVERVLDEAETWAKIDTHDHIVTVVDHGSEPLPWIAMEYMDGGHLGDRVGEMALPQALWTAIAVTKGVRHAHRRAAIAHLDLKPENILFRTADDAWDVPKVADWGLSKHLIDRSESVNGKTVSYAAPEQFDAETFGPADDMTDVYQLGAVFYELFTGRPPFTGDPSAVSRAILETEPTPPSEIAAVPEAIDEILLTALAKKKSNRHDDIVYLRDDLQAVFENH